MELTTPSGIRFGGDGLLRMNTIVCMDTNICFISIFHIYRSYDLVK